MERQKIKIDYDRPKMHRKILATTVDLVVFIFVFLTLFVSVRAIIQTTTRFDSAIENIRNVRSDSGVYITTDDSEKDVVSYFTDNADYSESQKQNKYTNAIEDFIEYVQVELGDESATEIENNYYTYRLDTELTYEGETYFILDSENNVVENPDCTADIATYNENVYEPYLDSNVQGYLNSLFPQYNSDVKYLFNILFYIELPISFIIGGVLVFYVPGLFFKRGRQTLGRALYRIGLVNKDYLAVPLGRYTAQWAIHFFWVFLLSFFTLGIPLIVSFSLMVFSKNKQTFSEYMLSIQEVSLEKSKIYYSRAEIQGETISKNKHAVKFTAEDRLL